MMELYRTLAEWWPLFSPPEEYAEEAAAAHALLRQTGARLETMLELGSGGGNMASHLKKHYRLTLAEPSPGMLDVSRALNPECEHLLGDMRSLRLGRTFDAVFIHDAIMYMTTEADLRAALLTAGEHCRPGGVVLIEPDCTRETFEPETDHGGSDGDGRSLRWLEWTHDPDPSDTTFRTEYILALRRGEELQTVTDRHVEGLFPRDTWLRLLREVGFEPRIASDPWRQEVFLGLRAG